MSINKVLIGLGVLSVVIFAAMFIVDAMPPWSPDSIKISTKEMTAACEQGIADGMLNYNIRLATAKMGIPLPLYSSSIFESMALTEFYGQAYVQVKRTCQEAVEKELEAQSAMVKITPAEKFLKAYNRALAGQL